jgi:hypothetical protein
VTGIGTDADTTARPAPGKPVRGLFRGTRAMLVVFVVLTALATNQLYVLSAHTDSWFAWTIRPPLTAAFLGAGYAAGCVFALLGLRSRVWVQARVAVVTVAVFATLTLVATLVHLDKFHFGADGMIAQFAAWFWLAVYIAVPVALVVLFVLQQRAPGADPPRRHPVPAWLVAAFTVQGLVMLAVGVALFAAPGTATALWPWPLTPLTARVVAAWLIAFGVAAAATLVERDLDRLAAGAVAYTVFGVLELLALPRFGGTADWGSAAGIGYLVVLVSVVPVGAAGWVLAARARRRPAAGAPPAAADPAG